MSREERRSYASEHQARKNGDRQYILLDLFSPLRLGGPEYDALDLVIYPSTCLEGMRVGVAGKVVQVRLEEPESLHASALANRHQALAVPSYQKRPIDRFLAQVYYEFLQCHGLIVDAD